MTLMAKASSLSQSPCTARYTRCLLSALTYWFFNLAEKKGCMDGDKGVLETTKRERKRKERQNGKRERERSEGRTRGSRRSRTF
jgi:hypothetical protein